MGDRRRRRPTVHQVRRGRRADRDGGVRHGAVGLRCPAAAGRLRRLQLLELLRRPSPRSARRRPAPPRRRARHRGLHRGRARVHVLPARTIDRPDAAPRVHRRARRQAHRSVDAPRVVHLDGAPRAADVAGATAAPAPRPPLAGGGRRVRSAPRQHLGGVGRALPRVDAVRVPRGVLVGDRHIPGSRLLHDRLPAAPYREGRS